jgi:YidC/Oxa1 family membrane protein insertase
VSFQQRILLAVGLCALIFVFFDALAPKPPPVEDTPATVTDPVDVSDPAAPIVDPEPREGVDAEPTTPVGPDVEVERHTIGNDLLSLEMTNRAPARGGIISGIELLADQFRGHQTAVDALGLQGAHTLEVGFFDESSDVRIPRGATYEVLERGHDYITLGYSDETVEVRQRFELLDGYEARLRVRVTNRSSHEQAHRIDVSTRIGLGESRYDVHRGLCRLADDFEDEDQGDVEDGPKTYGPDIRWGGVDGKYFATLVVPTTPADRCTIARAEESEHLVNRLTSPLVRLAPNDTREHVYGIYLGVKELDRLGAFTAVDLAEGDLQKAIDWGFFGRLSESVGRLLLALMRWFYDLTASWGVAIVLLTVVVKLVTLPLTLKQMRSMKRMKEIQPELDKIKKKYGDDRVKQGQEMQALFSRSGVNPLAGCLPMLVQLPIWFALYSMLGTAAELVHEPFIWLPDLTQQDPYYILPLGLGGMMILQNRMMPMAGDPTQAKMMRWVMPIMFTVFMLFLPSGLGVYIFVNIVLSVIQTAIQVGTGSKKSEPAAAAKTN